MNAKNQTIRRLLIDNPFMSVERAEELAEKELYAQGGRRSGKMRKCCESHHGGNVPHTRGCIHYKSS